MSEQLIERRVLHQRFADDMQEVVIRAATVYLERTGIVDLLKQQVERIDKREGTTSTRYFKERRTKRKLAASAPR